MAPPIRKLSMGAGNKTRFQNVTAQQTVKSSAGYLDSLIIANADAAVQTVTLFDGGTTLIVLRVPAGTTLQFQIQAQFATSILLTPSSANLDTLALWD